MGRGEFSFEERGGNSSVVGGRPADCDVRQSAVERQHGADVLLAIHEGRALRRAAASLSLSRRR